MTEGSFQILAIVGLGNPGEDYAITRHNLGFMVVQEMAKQLDLPFKADAYLNSLIAKGKKKDTEVHLLLPLTFMNESGWSVRRYLDNYHRTAAQIIVVCDDTALKFGQMRMRSQGSSGGHNGLKNIEKYLGTREFARLRMGVGSNELGQSLAEYVLSEFNSDERAVLGEYVKRGVEALKLLMTDSLMQVMNQVNTKLTL